MSAAVRASRTAEVRRGKPRSFEERYSRWIWGGGGVAAFLLFWEWGAANGIVNELFFSRPTAIVAAGVREVQLASFWTDVQVSASEFFIGYVLAFVLGVPIGLLAGWYRTVQYALDPYLNFFNSLPRFALLPIFLIMFGIGITSKIAIVFLGAFFAIVIPTIQGVKTVDRRLLDVAASFKASQLRLFWTVVLPATVPFIATGLRLGVARALIGVVTGELVGAQAGLGFMIKRAGEAFQTDRLLFAVLIFTVTGLVGVELLKRVENYFQRWRPIKGVAR